jgi:glycogenin glucosyltransferase
MRTAMMSGLIIGAAAAPGTKPTPPSQILVLGMHHSGTSVVANLTMMLGAFGGKVDEMLLHPDNPLKFWERRDVVTLDENRLTAGLGPVHDQYDVPDWIAYGFDSEKKAEKIQDSAEASEIVNKLNGQRPWVTKDPRMCLVASEWMELLDAPACVIVHRQPLSIANSMMIYSHNVSFAEWASVYSAYYEGAMRACKDVPTVVVQHDELVQAPFKTLSKLHKDLVKIGVEGLAMPAEERVNELLRPSSKEPPSFLASERKAVGSTAQDMSKAITTGAKFSPPPFKWMKAARNTGEAFATLLTTDNVDYFRGALTLGSSIRTFDSTRDLVALVTSMVPEEWHSALEVAGWTVLKVEEVAEFWWGQTPECSKFDGDQGQRWGHMATKLRLWQLKYKRVMYLDADTVLTGDASEVFNTVKGFGAEAPRYHDHFNAGVMVLEPSQKIFDELMALGSKEHKALFGNVVDCTEQGLLNSYFDGSEGREVTKLQVGRADIVADWSSEKAPFAVHWITHVCPKPWLVADQTEEIPSDCDPVVYSYWTRVWGRLTSSATDTSSANSFGSRETARRMLRRLSGVSAGPSMVSRRHDSMSSVLGNVHSSIGRQLRQLVTSRRELRRRRKRSEYDSSPWAETTWAWIAIIGTLMLGLGAGALMHKLFIKAPTSVTKGMTVVQAKRMGFQALGEGKGPVGVVSAVDDDDDEEEEDDDDDDEPPAKK